MPLNTQNFSQLVANEISVAQAASSSPLDFSSGSVLLALMQATASSIGLWLQGLATYDLALTRAATSNGTDLDSWMADFGVTRIPAVAATGQVTFSRLNNTIQAVIPINQQIQNNLGTVSYSVTLDTTNANYNAALNGYVLTAGTTSINVPIEANSAGIIGNAAANSITIISNPIPYVDSVTNSSTLVNGLNAEIDSALRTRFVLYLASLFKANKAALSYTILSVQGVVDFTITENQTYGGATQDGYFYVVVDDGTGNPSSTLLSNVSSAVDAVRALTTTFNVYAPVITNATVVLTIVVQSGYTHSIVAPIVKSALQTYINSLQIGETLYYSRIIQEAFDCTPGILNVSNVTINSGTSDLTADNQHVIKYTSVTVN